MPRAPEKVTTARLVLRRPHACDAADIFARYASNPEVTRYVGWPTHRTVDDTHGFLAFSDDQCDRWPAGPYLVCSRQDGSLLGSTGLMFESPQTAMTGYVLASDAWGTALRLRRWPPWSIWRARLAFTACMRCATRFIAPRHTCSRSAGFCLRRPVTHM